MSAERALLQRLIAGPVSGDALARENGETRAAVWKRIESLREAGVAIQAQPGRGSALAQPVDLLAADAIVMAMPDSARARVDRKWVVEGESVSVRVYTGGGRIFKKKQMDTTQEEQCSCNND